MYAHPLFRPLVAALVVALAAGVMAVLARPLAARLAGAPLGLLQGAENAPVTAPVVWVDSGDDTADAGRIRRDAALAIDAARRAGARTIVLAVPVEQPSDNADLARVRSFLDGADAGSDAAMRARLKAWVAELDHDAQLEQAIRGAGNVVLLASSSAPALERFAVASRGVGVEPATPPDADGVSRRERLLTPDAAGAQVPSLAFAGWLAARGIGRGEVRLEPAAVVAGSTRLRTGRDASWIPRYGRRADQQGGTPRVALAELVAGRVPLATLAHQLVVIGRGPATLAVPTGPGLSLGEATAQRIASLENNDYAVMPGFARLIALLVVVAAIAWAALFASRLNPAPRVVITVLVTLGAIVLEIALLAAGRVWIPLLLPALALPLATAAVGLTPERRRERPARPEPVVPRPASAPRSVQASSGAPALRAAAPLVDTPPTVQMPARPPLPAAPSLREISKTLEARREEPTRAEVADLLLGRSRRPPKPKLGRYELERELGRGAMGTVYLGRDPRINRVVAIKAIPIVEEFSEADLAEARSRFFREAEMAGRLKHPGIVTVYDAGEDGGIAWIAMEYVNGQTLGEFVVSDRLLPAAQVLELVARVAESLDYAHAQDVVHRDIKPANVLFDPTTLETKITDFGIARLTNSSATRTGVVLGTPSFMAPEQLEGRNVTGRSDLFALGVTLFQLLAGQLPFRADSMTGLMDKIANSEHPPLPTIRPELPPCVSSIIDRALQKEPAKRYASAGEMARALRACAPSLSA
jgi:protein kinase-like protein/CHASE2 domain-containing protein